MVKRSETIISGRLKTNIVKRVIKNNWISYSLFNALKTLKTLKNLKKPKQKW